MTDPWGGLGGDSAPGEPEAGADGSPTAVSGAHDDSGDNTENEFATVYAFVEQYVTQVYAEDLVESARELVWCPQWFRHPEAVARLEAAWHAFEQLRQEAGTGRSTWFRDHGDPCMNRLLAKEGPFQRCDHGRHKLKPALPVDQPAAFLVDHAASTVHPPDPH